MADPFTGEIRVFGFKFAPRSWALCNGQLLNIAQNTALFSLLGTFYGGNGSVTFALPNLQGRHAVGWGQGRGLSPYNIGQSDGGEGVQLQIQEIPGHPHDWNVSVELARLKIPAPTRSYAKSVGDAYISATPDTNMAAQTIGQTGQSLPHSNLQPSLAINYCIALEGVYPKRG